MSWVVYNQHESVLRGNVNYNFQLALNASTLTPTSGELVVTSDVNPQLALLLCEDKLSLGCLGAGGGSLEEEWHTSPKVTAAFIDWYLRPHAVLHTSCMQ